MTQGARNVGARSGWLALLAIVGLLGVQAGRTKPLPIAAFDQPFYLGIAHDLLTTGRFTDGFMFAQPGPDGTRPSGMRFAPLYPALVAAAALLDPGLRRGMACVVATDDKDPGCPSAAPGLRGLQFAELCGFLWLVWWLGLAVGGPPVGWVSLLLSAGAAPLLLGSVMTLMTEMTCLLLSTAAIAAGVAAMQASGARRRLAWAGAAGGLLGLTILTRPAFLYLLPAVLLAIPLRGGRRAGPSAAMLGTCAAGVLAPWLLRNWLILGHAALTRGYDSHTLVQRIAFDTMSWREYGMAYVCWLPDGRAAGRMLAGAGACDRFGWDAPNSFYLVGLGRMLPESLAAAGGYDHHLFYLLRHYIFQMPIKHVLVSIPLALRGAYVSHWWGFLLLPMAAWTSGLALRRRLGRSDAFLAVALPAWFMLAFNAAVAVNQVRYNLLLVSAYAVGGGLAVSALWHRFDRQIKLTRLRTA